MQEGCDVDFTDEFMKAAAVRKALLVIECDLQRMSLAGHLAGVRAAAAEAPGAGERVLAVVAAAEAVLDCAGSLRNLGGERGAVMLGRVRTGLVAVRVAVMVWASFRPLRKED
jgi:hypothetical protein